jgi:hypothetical protein
MNETENPCRAILIPLFAKDFEIKVQAYIRNQQPFVGSFEMRVNIQLNDSENRGLIQFSTIYTWKDSWGMLAAQATYLTAFNMEIINPSFYRISPPHKDFLYPLKSTIDDLRIRVNNTCSNADVKFVVDEYSDEYYMEVIRKYIVPKF